jgi:hypothetical protein
MLAGLGDEQARVLDPLKTRLERAKQAIEALAQEADPGLAALRLRPHAEALADIFFALCLAQDVAAEVDPTRRAAETTLLEHFAAITLSATEEERDHSYADRVRQVADF